ncbi:hypothetical protein BJP36_39700 [Moorena producens JHB]|uniref:Uncharacterized protein n=1 Tax=Moorena producens (strain JHB) TaxID=1454205 RepID=A0A9Q9SV33_MOOP1|nr:hypothetical protein [Moorena producens]WAN70180.1 hypothetical protein BJP36_39700 [Moorena producens JHB]
MQKIYLSSKGLRCKAYSYLTLPALEGRGFLLGRRPRYANNEVTCYPLPEPVKIEVSSTQAYLVYDLGFGVPETKP